MQQHQISGDWIPVDQSKNTLELAETPDSTPKGERIVALRSTYDTEQPPQFMPASHVRNLVEAYDAGRLRRLLGTR